MEWEDFRLDDSQLTEVISNEVGSELFLFRRVADSDVTDTTRQRFRWATGYEWIISSDEDINWDIEFENQVDSNNLWLYSLVAVGRLSLDALPDSSNHFWAEKIVTDFIARCSDPRFVERLKTMPSSDHSGATRVASLVSYLQLLRLAPHKDWNHIGDVVALLRFWCTWLSEGQRFAKNNHGVMVGMSLLNGAAQLDGLSAAEEYARVAEHRVKVIVEESFDEDGMCFENTVGYHNFNLTLYRRIINFLSKRRPESATLLYLQEFMDKAERALAIAIRPDQTIPPLGDSPVYKVDRRSINSSKSFKDSGLTIIKSDELYLSFVCGSRSEAHKQQDDTSFTLFYRGKDVVTDGGSYNYDKNDRFRQSIQSSYGHSGIFPQAFEGLSRRELLRATKGDAYAKTTTFVDADKFAAVRGVAGWEEGAVQAIRKIVVSWPDEVVIVDTVDHDDSVADSGWVNRVVFGSNLSIDEVGERRYDFADGQLIGTMLTVSDGDRELYRGQDDVVVRGWCSVKNGEIRKTHGLDIKTDLRASRFVTGIKLGTRADSLDDFSDIARRFAIGAWDPFSA